MTIQAGWRRFIARVEYHNGNLNNGEPTYNVKTDWVPYIREMPVRYRGNDPGTYGGEVVRGKQIESIVSGSIELLNTPLTRGITPTMRFVINGRVMNIMNIYDKRGEQDDIQIQVKEIDLG